MDNSNITKFELSSKEQKLKNKFFKQKTNEQIKELSTLPKEESQKKPIMKEETKKNPLLGETKAVIKDLRVYDSLYQKEGMKEAKENPIQKILSPIYTQISQLKEEMKEMTQYTDVKNNTKIQQHSMTKTDVNDLYNLHVKFQQSKNNLCDAMDYVNGNSEHISYQDMEIVKALDDLRDTFEVMSKEMDNIESEFNEKFSFAIKERKRQKIAKELLDGTYRTKNDYAKKMLNDDDIMPSSLKLLDKVNYNDYMNDITDIGNEKDILLNDYKNEKDIFGTHLPKLVNPKEKNTFTYGFDDENTKNSIIDTKTFKNPKMKEIKTVIEQSSSSGNIMSTSYQTSPNANSQSMLSKSNIKPKKDNTKQSLSKEKNVIIYEKEEDKFNDDITDDENKKRKMSPSEKMSLFQKNMNNSYIETARPKQPPERKRILIGPSKQDIIRGIQARSSKTKKTLQTFKKKRRGPIYYREEFPLKMKGFRNGKYPPQKEKDDGLPKKGPKESHEYKDDYRVHYPYGIPDQEMKDSLEKMIELYIRDAMRNKRDGGNGRDRTRIEILNEGGNQRGRGNDDLLKLLIQKFGDLENAIKGNWGNNRNGEGGYGDGGNGSAEDIANRLFNY